jgi:hypothetical protein
VVNHRTISTGVKQGNCKQSSTQAAEARTGLNRDKRSIFGVL